MRLKTKLVLAITLLVFLISALLSLVYVSQLLHASVEQSAETNRMVANQVTLAVQDALRTGLKDRKFDPTKPYADCIAPAAARAPEGSIDMGTGYDCSDAKGHTAAASITPAQRRWRNTLVTAMARQGFVNYSKEWWHFSLPAANGQAYDFPIPVRR